MTELFAVAGRPIRGSLSPLLFTAAFCASGRDAHYVRLAADEAVEALDLARELGVRGFNVTAPFKEPMVHLVDDIDPAARRIGAVNTVLFADGRAIGYNTDPAGVAASLVAAGADPAGKTTVVLGSGGAARAAAFLLRDRGAKNLTIAARNARAGRALADASGGGFVLLDDAPTALAAADIVVACWPPTAPAPDLGRLVPDRPVIDACYRPTALGSAARAAGALYVDGRPWLVSQAEAAYALFTGAPAPEGVMAAALSSAKEPPTETAPLLVLEGIMGAGKTTVGARLATLCEARFIDTDETTARSAGMAVADLIESRGLPRFRALEREAAIQSLRAKNAVVALGGGAPLDPEVRRQLRKRAAVVIWLHAPAAVCARRAADGTRPLIAGPDPETAIAKLCLERRGAYAEAATLVVATQHRDADEVARRILDEIDA